MQRLLLAQSNQMLEIEKTVSVRLASTLFDLVSLRNAQLHSAIQLTFLRFAFGFSSPGSTMDKIKLAPTLSAFGFLHYRKTISKDGDLSVNTGTWE
jgi:hypothetical protein